MIRNFKQILEKARNTGRKKLAVPAPRSRRVFQLLKEAEKTGLIIPVPVGALDEAIAMAQNGDVDLLFQGDAGMEDFINALTVKEAGIAERESLSYISLF